MNVWWWWLLVLILLVPVGFVVCDIYQRTLRLWRSRED